VGFGTVGGFGGGGGLEIGDISESLLNVMFVTIF
jgi:hypothetical protein